MGKIHKKIDKNADLIVYTVKGKIFAADIKEIIQLFYQGNVSKYVLWDIAEGDLSSLSTDDVQSIASTPRDHSDKRIGGKTALVAAKDAAFGLARMFEILTGHKNFPFETQVFRSIDDAKKWLFEKK